MSKIPSFGFRSKLKAPSGFKTTQSKDAVPRRKDETEDSEFKEKSEGSVTATLSHPSSSDVAGNNDTSSSQCNGDVDVASGENSSNNNKSNKSNEPSADSGNSNVEGTSKNLSKLADKLNSGNATKAAGFTSKLPQKPVFRRKGSSNIAKLSSGQAKDRLGATQIHGQTPYMKSPQPISKLPKQRGRPQPNSDSKRVKISGVPSSRVTRSNPDIRLSEHSGLNETIELPKGTEKGNDISEDVGTSPDAKRSSAAAATSTAATTLTTAATGVTVNGVQRRPAVLGAKRFGLRPRSAVLASGTNVIPKGDTRMKPPSHPVSRAGIIRVNGQDLSVTGGKGVVSRRSSKPEISISLPNGKPGLKTPGTGASVLKTPSKDLRNMAEKLRTYSGKRSQRPKSMSSAAGLMESGNKTQERGTRRSLLPGDLRGSNSSSMQDISRGNTSSAQNDLKGETPRRRSGSLSSKKDIPLSRVKSHSTNSLSSAKDSAIGSSCSGMLTADGKSRVSSSTSSLANATERKKTQGTNANNFAIPRKVLTGFPRPRSKSKTSSSASSEFGMSSSLISGPCQSTPVHDSSNIGSSGANQLKHSFSCAVNENISAVFVDGPTPQNQNGTFVVKRRVLNETFDEPERNEMMLDETVTCDDAMTHNALLNDTQVEHAPVNSWSKLPQIDTTFNQNETQSLDANETQDISTKEPKSQDYPQSTVNRTKLISTDRSSFQDTENTQDIVNFNSDISSEEPVNPEPKPALPKAIDAVYVTDNNHLDGYCSDDFIMNETMPRVDGSLTMNMTDDAVDMNFTPLVETSEGIEKEGNKGIAATSTHVKASQPKSALRSLDFKGNKKGDIPQQQGDVLATSLINDSYDIVTVEEASESDEGPGLSSGKLETSESPRHEKSEVKNAAVVGETQIVESQLVRQNCIRRRRTSSPINIAHKGDAAVSQAVDGGKDSLSSRDVPNGEVMEIEDTKSNIAASNEKPSDTTAPNKFQIKHELLRCKDETITDLRSQNESSNLQRSFSSLLSQTVETCVADSGGTSFRIPREASISEMGDGNVMIDEATFRHYQNDVRIIKTNLLKLKRALHEADVMSPFLKYPTKLGGGSPPVTPSRHLLSRSCSDASSWLFSKVSKSPEKTSMDSLLSTGSKPTLSSNKTDEDKVEDEMKVTKERVNVLERENEELKRDLEVKDYTIKLLQAQLENHDIEEQIELLTEEKIMLLEENQALKELVDQLENHGKHRTESTVSIKDEFLKQSRSASKLKAEIVQSYYEREDE